MIKKKYHCPQCGFEFIAEVFESRREAEEYFRQHPHKVPVKVKCPSCGTVLGSQN